MILGRLGGGKIIFTTLSFSAMILACVFQSEMVTLMTNRVRYADIETIDELAESDLQIQSDNFVLDRKLFESDSKPSILIHEKLNNRMGYLSFLLQNLYGQGAMDFNKKTSEWEISNKYDHRSLENHDRFRNYVDELNRILKTDAFLIFFHFQSSHEQINHYLKLNFLENYRVVDECVMNYPFTLSFSKYSLYSGKLKDHILRFAEGGFPMYWLTKLLDFHFHSINPTLNDSPEITRRPDSLVDLGMGFSCLTVGLCISCLVFVAELLIFVC